MNALSLKDAVEEMGRRADEARHRYDGARELLTFTPYPRVPEVSARFELIKRRMIRRHAAWQRLAAAQYRVEGRRAAL